MPPILAAVAHLAQLSKIRATGTFAEPFILFTSTVSFASTGKSTSLAFVRDEISKLETLAIGDARPIPNQASGLYFICFANMLQLRHIHKHIMYKPNYLGLPYLNKFKISFCKLVTSFTAFVMKF